MLLVEEHGKVVRNLTTGRDDNAVRCLEVDDVHYALECKLVEVETVTHIVVSRYGLGVIVDHNRTVALLADGVERLNATPVELYRRTDTVSARTKNDDRTLVVLECDVALHTSVCNVQIVGLCRILSGKSVNLLDYRKNAIILTTCTNHERSLTH